MGRLIPLLLTLAAVLAAAAPVQADDDHEAARELLREGAILPLAELITKLPFAPPLRILEVELEREDGRYLYEIELLDNRGQVWEVEMDAASGELIESEPEHH